MVTRIAPGMHSFRSWHACTAVCMYFGRVKGETPSGTATSHPGVHNTSPPAWYRCETKTECPGFSTRMFASRICGRTLCFAFIVVIAAAVVAAAAAAATAAAAAAKTWTAAIMKHILLCIVCMCACISMSWSACVHAIVLAENAYIFVPTYAWSQVSRGSKHTTT